MTTGTGRAIDIFSAFCFGGFSPGCIRIRSDGQTRGKEKSHCPYHQAAFPRHDHLSERSPVSGMQQRDSVCIDTMLQIIAFYEVHYCPRLIN
jgi:hypothetical protein